jgi:hypothetical protein
MLAEGEDIGNSRDASQQSRNKEQQERHKGLHVCLFFSSNGNVDRRAFYMTYFPTKHKLRIQVRYYNKKTVFFMLYFSLPAEKQHDEVWYEEGSTPGLVHVVGKPPDVAQAHRIPAQSTLQAN